MYNNVSGMALYRLNQLLYHKAPYHQEHLAAGGTFTSVIDIPLVYPFLNRPEDTIFASGRYGSVELQITTGALAVFAPAAPATCPVTYGIEIERTLAALSGDGKSDPYNGIYVSQYPNIATATQLFWNLESAMDLSLFGFCLYNHDILLVEGAVPWCSPAAGGVDNIATVTFQDPVRFYLNAAQLEFFQKERDDLIYYDEYDGTALPVAATEIPTNHIGLYPHFFVKNGSVNEQFMTGRKSFITCSFTLVGAAGTQRADLLTFGQRALR